MTETQDATSAALHVDPRDRRRQATVSEAKALSHPLRVRILRLCTQHELTNKELADRLGQDPGTVLYHVRKLVDAGFLVPAPVRTGPSGALEKPYRSSGQSWWLSDPLGGNGVDRYLPPIEAFQEELRDAGPGAVETFERFALHLSPQQLEELDLRIVAILDEYVLTENERLDQPMHGGLFVLHRLAE
jgi:DNA-binding transcriptional ArsR family regulator